MAKEFKRAGRKDFKDKKSSESPKSRTDKRDKKPSFERFRDDSRPSDFGSSKRSGSGRGGFRKKHADNSSFKQKQDNYEDRPSYEDKVDDKPKFDRKSFSDKPAFKKKYDDSDRKSSYRDKGEDKPRTFEKKFGDKPAFKKKYDDGGDRKSSFRGKRDGQPSAFPKEKTSRNPYDMDERDLEYGKPRPSFDNSRGRDYKKKPYVKKTYSTNKTSVSKPQRTEDDGKIRLNKYLSNAGISSRREADQLIASGVVQVNGKTITEMGFRVSPTDIIKYGGQTLKKERMVYLILNKPKDYITTFDDPQKRRTVLELVQGACKERIYPVGRLDRATTGLLMFTNDGDLTKKLTHPRYGVRKIYHVELDKPLKRQDLDQIAEGIELEDGPIKVDEVTYVGNGADKTQVGVEIHSGKNRIVRRIFEHMGYNVRKLDRVMFGSLTKKDLARGRWRFLTEAEIGILKMISIASS
ncbi:MAG: rRNA pseudouridine synthase [Bacteroidetes bacterium]|nr:rRNA pseudouridine synthase [Bacteroidota bacterium]